MTAKSQSQLDGRISVNAIVQLLFLILLSFSVSAAEFDESSIADLLSDSAEPPSPEFNESALADSLVDQPEQGAFDGSAVLLSDSEQTVQPETPVQPVEAELAADYTISVQVIEEVVTSTPAPQVDEAIEVMTEQLVQDVPEEIVNEPVPEFNESSIADLLTNPEQTVSVPIEPSAPAVTEQPEVIESVEPIATPEPLPAEPSEIVAAAVVEQPGNQTVQVIETVDSPAVAPYPEDALEVMIDSLGNAPVEGIAVLVNETEIPVNVTEPIVPAVLDAEGKELSVDIVVSGDTVAIEFKEGPLEEIHLLKVAEGESDLPRVDDVPLNIPSPSADTTWAQIYAIDPTNTDFELGVVEVVAKGTSLYKCKEWNFDARSCEGSWQLVATDMVPGNTYLLEISPDDPAFGETIIVITKAEHLDENRTFVSDIYDSVKELDDVWSEPIFAGEYIRVNFEQNLTSANDITLYVRNNQSLNTSIEVYYFNSSEKIAEFPLITTTDYYKVFLTNMTGTHDTFDLKIVSNDSSAYLEFDHIIDPSLSSGNGTFFEGWESNSFSTNSWSTTGIWAIVTSPVSPVYQGTYAAQAKNTGGVEKTISTNVSTINYQNINFSFVAKTANLDVGEYIAADWYNGSTWTQVLSSQTISSWTNYSFALGATADNNANFAIRFRCKNNIGNEECDLDDINVTAGVAVDSIKPNVTALQPANGTIYDINATVPIRANVSDNVAVDKVQVNVTLPNSTMIQQNMSLVSGSTYEANFTSTSLTGQYNFTIIANDTSNNINSSERGYFNIQDIATPTYSSLTEEPSDPATYAPAAQYRFNATWTDNVGIANVTLQFDGVNYTDFTVSGNVYSRNFTGLSGGTHNYIWFANDTASNTNNTGILTYTINPASDTINLTLNGIEANLTVTYPTSTTANASSTSGTHQLYRNGTLVTNPETTTFAVGIYEYKANSTGNSNYSANATGKTFILTVDKASSLVNLTLNGTDGNITIEVGSTINITGTLITGQGGFVQIFEDGTQILNGTSPISTNRAYNSLGNYNITLVYSETQNYTSSSETHFVNVVDTTPPTISNVSNSSTTNQSSNIVWNTNENSNSSVNYGTTLSLGTRVGNSSLVTSHTIALTGLTNSTLYYYNVTSCDSNSNCAASGPYNFTTNSNPPDITAPSYSNLTEEPSDPATYAPGVQYRLNATWTDNVGIANVTLQFDGINYTDLNISGNVYSRNFTNLVAGTHNYTWYANDFSGNTNNTGTLTYTINKASTTTQLFLNGNQSNLTVTYLTSTNATATTGAGSVALYRNGSSVSNPEIATLAAGTYNYTAINSGNENYTGSSVTHFLTVSKASSIVNLQLNGVDGNITVEVGSTVNLTGTRIAGEGNIELYDAGVLINSGSSPLTNLTTYTTLGTRNITVSYPASQNYTTSSETHLVTIVDSTWPGIILNSPANNTVTPLATYSFNFTATDNIDTSLNCTLKINSVGVANNAGTLNSTPTILSGNLSTGSNTWSVECTDDAPNGNESDVYTIVRDITPPNVTIIAPINAAFSYGATVAIQANVTDNNVLGFVVANITKPNGANDSMTLLLIGNTTYEGNYTGTNVAGVYNFTINASDTVGNINDSEKGNFTVNPQSGGGGGGGGGGGTGGTGGTGASSAAASSAASSSAASTSSSSSSASSSLAPEDFFQVRIANSIPATSLEEVHIESMEGWLADLFKVQPERIGHIAYDDAKEFTFRIDSSFVRDGVYNVYIGFKGELMPIAESFAVPGEYTEKHKLTITVRGKKMSVQDELLAQTIPVQPEEELPEGFAERAKEVQRSIFTGATIAESKSQKLTALIIFIILAMLLGVALFLNQYGTPTIRINRNVKVRLHRGTIKISDAVGAAYQDLSDGASALADNFVQQFPVSVRVKVAKNWSALRSQILDTSKQIKRDLNEVSQDLGDLSDEYIASVAKFVHKLSQRDEVKQTRRVVSNTYQQTVKFNNWFVERLKRDSAQLRNEFGAVRGDLSAVRSEAVEMGRHFHSESSRIVDKISQHKEVKQAKRALAKVGRETNKLIVKFVKVFKKQARDIKALLKRGVR